jgi:uncharacterized protein
LLETRQAELYRYGCERGVLRGCMDVGWGYEFGQGVLLDHVLAARFYEKACLGGEPKGCGRLGWVLEHYTTGAPPDRSRALDAYLEGCHHEDSWACDQAKRLRTR